MKYYQIADAAKQVDVESHVLRYWEDELELPIERNKQGHRLYTEEDLSRFRYIKELKKEGLQLRAIRAKVHLRDRQLSGDGIADGVEYTGEEALKLPEKKKERVLTGETDKSQKAAKLCMMLQQMVSAAVRRENEQLLVEVKKGVSETVSKEMNYQFGLQEQRQEEHYKRIDELLREKERYNRLTRAEKKRIKKDKKKIEIAEKHDMIKEEQ